MTDMLVKLYALPPMEQEIARQQENGIAIRRAIAPEKHFVLKWVRENFSEFWASETDVAFGRTPPTVWIAIEDKRLIGFGCYDTTAKGFFGPTGVSDTMRGKGVGKVLTLACLHAMRWDGYGYAIIGAVGPIEFYQKVANAVVIEDSTPSVYKDLLRQ
ncbi:MAG: GNAT family N-acetyltransferase [Anaerolineaceae bacterium]|nr:GNAT family N-acetyltransferase [Anaerolineaceae bacterium]